MLIDSDILEMKRKADDDDPVSMYQMFVRLNTGKGIKEDRKTAISYLIRLANLGATACVEATSIDLDPSHPFLYSDKMICAYDFILSLIGDHFRENNLPEQAALWYKKALDFVDMEFYRWTEEERLHIKKGLWAYRIFYGSDGYQGVYQYYDEQSYCSFKLAWEQKHGMNNLLKTFLQNFTTPPIAANLPLA